MVLWIPEIDDLTRFCATNDNSDDTAWKNILIWSDETKSGNLAGSSEIKSKKLLNKFGKSKTKAWSWMYKRGTSHNKIAAPVTTNIPKVRINAILVLIS